MGAVGGLFGNPNDMALNDGVVPAVCGRPGVYRRPTVLQAAGTRRSPGAHGRGDLQQEPRRSRRPASRCWRSRSTISAGCVPASPLPCWSPGWRPFRCCLRRSRSNVEHRRTPSRTQRLPGGAQDPSARGFPDVSGESVHRYRRGSVPELQPVRPAGGMAADAQRPAAGCGGARHLRPRRVSLHDRVGVWRGEPCAANRSERQTPCASIRRWLELGIGPGRRGR